jgi:hypothetical protein
MNILRAGLPCGLAPLASSRPDSSRQGGVFAFSKKLLEVFWAKALALFTQKGLDKTSLRQHNAFENAQQPCLFVVLPSVAKDCPAYSGCCPGSLLLKALKRIDFYHTLN